MNHELHVDLIPQHSQITSMISNNHFVPNSFPLPGSVKPLVHPAVETEGAIPYLTVKR